tara:strand:- start:364 stop:891 length:528 start_codon:yes stop_codon:yes gene_type:complete
MSEKVWDYRIVRGVKEDGTDADWYSIQEVYYDDDGNPNAQSIDLQVEGEDNKEMKIQLEDMMSAIDKPVLNERDIVPESSREIKETITPPTLKLGTDGRGSDIYESPDGGNTIYRRESGNDERTVVQKIMDDNKMNTAISLNQTEYDNIKQKILNLEMENSELKDMLKNQGVDIV